MSKAVRHRVDWLGPEPSHSHFPSRAAAVRHVLHGTAWRVTREGDVYDDEQPHGDPLVARIRPAPSNSGGRSTEAARIEITMSQAEKADAIRKAKRAGKPTNTWIKQLIREAE